MRMLKLFLDLRYCSTMSEKWWTLMMASVMPKVRRRVRVISRRVRPFSSTRALGRVSVRGRRRVPRPAARILAFIQGLSWEEARRVNSEEWVVSGQKKRGKGVYTEGTRTHKREERFLAAQADRFAGANRCRKIGL